jgi:hypothetical protein
VYVDNEFDALELHSPESGAVVGGEICFEGTADDHTCLDHYVVQYKPASGGTWGPVDPNNPVYTTAVTNSSLAWWTDASGLPDGDYFVALAGYTATGAAASHQSVITLDNTPPIAEITYPSPCTQINDNITFGGTADDANLDRWKLEYWNPTTHAWAAITGGTAPVVESALGTWNIGSLPPCYYVVRLRVWDQSTLNICGNPARQCSEDYLGVAVGDPCPGDLTGDGEVNLYDLAELFMYYGNICW